MRTQSSPAVLVVEDEVVVAIHLRECLSDLGVNAHVFTEGVPALQAAAYTQYRAAVLDLGLPDIAGQQIVTALLERDPNFPILLTTGQDFHETQRQFARASRVRVLSKPYDAAMLEIELVKLGVVQSANRSQASVFEEFAAFLQHA